MREFNSNIRFEICICFINNNWYDVMSLSLINIEFLGIEVLLCHNPYCFSSQSQSFKWVQIALSYFSLF